MYRLKRASYELKQVPRAWHTRIDSYLLARDFERCLYEHTLYIKSSVHSDIFLVCFYGDDLIFTGNNLELIAEFMEATIKQFEMIDMGLMSYFLRIEVFQSNSGIFIYIKKCR